MHKWHYPFLVEATGFEPTTSWSRTKRATNCATPRDFFKRIHYNKYIPRCQTFLQYILRVFHIYTAVFYN